jgi:hypothetical protein
MVTLVLAAASFVQPFSPAWYLKSERSVPRMNTKNQQDQKKNQGQKARQEHGLKKQGQNPSMLQGNQKHQDHDQEHAETRLTR